MTRLKTYACLALLAVSLPAAAEHIRDAHAGLLDVPARHAFLAAHITEQPFADALKFSPSCKSTPLVPAPPSPMTIPHHYLNGSSGPTNPAEKEATEVYQAFETRTTRGMNRWLATGDEAEAQCALAQLDAWAQAGALTNYDAKAYSQSWFQAEWTLASAGVTESVLREDKSLDPATQQRVVDWLDHAARELIGNETPNGSRNNHHYWRALAAISIGVLAHDDKLFNFAIDAYKGAIETIDNNGALPLEMARHENAIHYQAFALAPLVMVAEYATRQGVDLYSYSAHDRKLINAIQFLGRAIADPTIVRQYTTDPQKTNFGAGDYAPFAFYIARFGPAGVPANIVSGITAHANSTRIGGNTVLMAVK